MKVELESTVKHDGALSNLQLEIKNMVDAAIRKIAMTYPAWADLKIKVEITAKHE